MPPLLLPTDAESRFLKGLTQTERVQVLASAKLRHIPAKKPVIQQNDPADHFFLITRGQARYFFVTDDRRKVILFRLGPGDVFGGATILSEPSRYLVGTETVKDSQVLVWERTSMSELTARYPRLMQNILLIAYDYLGWYITAHVGLTCHTAAQRFAAVLVTLARTVGQIGPRGMEVEATNEELASAAAVTKFTASRLMSEWQRSGVILKERGKVVISSPGRLLSQKGIKMGN